MAKGISKIFRPMRNILWFFRTWYHDFLMLQTASYLKRMHVPFPLPRVFSVHFQLYDPVVPQIQNVQNLIWKWQNLK